jgi:hypothetical protein
VKNNRGRVSALKYASLTSEMKKWSGVFPDSSGSSDRL